MDVNAVLMTDDDLEFIEEIKENLETLLATPVGTIPLDRDFGINMDFVGQPPAVATAMMQQEIIAKVEKYEPRVLIKEIDVVVNEDGSLTPHISISKNDDYENTKSDESNFDDDALYYDNNDYDADEESEDEE